MRNFLFALGSALLSVVTADLSQTVVGFNSLHTCSILDFQLPGLVSFPGSDVYNQQVRSYWASNQGELVASCRVTPRTSEDVQKIMFLISQTKAVFAIRSGGHSVVASSSNVADGVVIDLGLLKHVNIRSDLGIVDVGAGARWRDVYQELDRNGIGLHVAGARAGSVGVGGYLLGGGISVFAGTHGWSCDQVRFFEVVLANGTLLEVDARSEPDLYKSLKGGGSNFGVVTRVGLELIQLSQSVDIVFLQYEWADLSDVIQALTTYNVRAHADPMAALSLSIGTDLHQSAPAITIMMSHQDGVAEDGIFAPFFEIPCQVNLHERFSQLSLGSMYDEMNSEGYRQFRSTTTMYNDATLLTEFARNLSSAVKPRLVDLGDDEVRGGVLLQPLTESHLRHNIAGGNIVGLEEEITPLVLISMELRYVNSTYDETSADIVSEYLVQLDKDAVQHRLAHSYRYLNYASCGQQPFKHIQERNDSKSPWPLVEAVKRKFDPNNVFGRQIHDPFRIPVS